MTDDREEIARIIDHEGYWERLDSCNHALATVSMTDDQRRALTAVRDDELRGTASSLAKADAILARQGPGPGEAVAWRPEVVAFANLMEAQLRANDHKGGWRNDRAADLHSRLLEEAEELFDALNWRSAFLGAADPERIGSEAADVANFAMMIADVCGALDATPTREA